MDNYLDVNSSLPPQPLYSEKCDDLRIWLMQNESHMHARGITAQTKKFHITLSGLPRAIFAEVIDLVESPPQQQPYDRLKQILLARTGLSEEQKIQQLLAKEKLGDRKPTQMLRRIKSLAGNFFSETVIRHLFIQSMPPEIKISLASLDPNTPVDEVAKIADRVMSCTNSVSPPTIAASATNNTATDSDTAAAVRDLISFMREWTTQFSNTPDTRSKNKRFTKTKPRQRSGSPIPYCYYHRTYGRQAKKCQKPCSFNTGRSEN